MADPPLHFENFSGAYGFQLGQQTIYYVVGNQYLSNGGEDLTARLNPIPDACHTRDRKTSPPDSACFPGTREGVITEITNWADTVDLALGTEHGEIDTTISTLVLYTPTPHIYWLHGFAGCGKSAVSLKVADIFEGSGRLLASYFFFRNAGDRNTMKRFAATLASQMASALPSTAPFIDAALSTNPGILDDRVSLTRQLERLVYTPFQSAVKKVPVKGPFIIVIDGLDECEDKRGVRELIDSFLCFFEEYPYIPLRIFITSRVEQHIRERLETDGVRLGNLDSHSSRKDIEKFLWISFRALAEQDRVLRSYIRMQGSWPTKSDMDKLVQHIGGSFVLASALFRFIVEPANEEDPLTPVDRLPLTLKMNGLDSLYTQTLARSQHLPHFQDIISTIALVPMPLPITGIADLLGIQVFEVVHVLTNLQAIIHVPGTDDKGFVVLCHTSLRDFLTTGSRSGSFFVPSSFHLHLSYLCFTYILEKDNGLSINYARHFFHSHWRSFARSNTRNLINEIEQFSARQLLRINGVPSHAFLCSLLFYTFSFSEVSSTLSDTTRLQVLTECTKQLALAVEFPDYRIGSWLEAALGHGFPDNRSWTVQFVEDTYATIQQNLRCASTAIHDKFPEILKHQVRSYGKESKFEINRFPSAIGVFRALEWIIARAEHNWEKLNIKPRPPLELSVYQDDQTFQRNLSFDGVPAAYSKG